MHIPSTDRSKQRADHRKHFAQFVTQQTIDNVVRAIGAKKIINSTDFYLNDIPLKKGQWHQISHMFLRKGFSLADCVCIAKEAARQYRENVGKPALDAYEARVQVNLDLGMTRSDAQGVVDAEDRNL